VHKQEKKTMRIVLQPLITISAVQLTASLTQTGVDKYFANYGMLDVRRVVVTLNMVLADRTDGNETYDFYITSFHKLGSGVLSRWDIAHFTQIATVTARYYTMFIGSSAPGVQEYTAAAPPVATGENILATITDAAAQGRGTLGATLTRNNAIGEGLNWTLIAAGTTPGPITFEISALVF
jgi:hypothetical protein